MMLLVRCIWYVYREAGGIPYYFSGEVVNAVFHQN